MNNNYCEKLTGNRRRRGIVSETYSITHPKGGVTAKMRAYVMAYSICTGFENGKWDETTGTRQNGGKEKIPVIRCLGVTRLTGRKAAALAIYDIFFYKIEFSSLPVNSNCNIYMLKLAHCQNDLSKPELAKQSGRS